MTDWRPLKPALIHDVLDEGIPEWLMPTLQDLLNYTQRQFGNQNRSDELFDLMYRFDRLRRGREVVGPAIRQTYLGSVLASRREQGDEDVVLEAIDFLLSSGVLVPGDIREAFEEAGSKWTAVAPGPRGGLAGLVERVSEGVREAAESAMALPGSGALLTDAWHAAFGRGPDPEEAYEKAIKAVEAAGTGVVSPKNSMATLGTMIADMRDQRVWRLPTSVPGREQGYDAVLKMAEALWHGQGSRHGGNGYIKPTQEQGEAAVLLAVPLVHYFERGIVARGEKWPEP